MHTPTKSQWQAVIDNTKKAMEMATDPDHLDMEQVRVNVFDHKCGTIHCWGGWYAVVTLDNSGHLSYMNGARQIAIDLGFNVDPDDGDPASIVEDWADDSPDIWGNDNGSAILSGRNAFKSDARPGGALTLQHIVDHLEEVRDRSPE